MAKLVDDLVWLLEEAARGNLDPGGRDRWRVEMFVGRLTDDIINKVLERVAKIETQHIAEVPTLPMPFDPWEHLRPPSEGTEPR